MNRSGNALAKTSMSLEYRLRTEASATTAAMITVVAKAQEFTKAVLEGVAATVALAAARCCTRASAVKPAAINVDVEPLETVVAAAEVDAVTGEGADAALTI